MHLAPQLPHWDTTCEYQSLGDAETLALLHESNAFFREAFTYAAIGMALVGLDGRCLKVNDALCAMLGYSADELGALNLQSLTYPDDLGAERAHTEQLLAGDVPAYHLEKRYRHRDGALIWAILSVSLVRDAAGRPLYLITQIQDVTARKHAELAIQEREAWFQALYEQSPDSILLLDPHHPSGGWPIIDCNPMACAMHGYSRAELLHQSIDLLRAHPCSAQDRAVYLGRLRAERGLRFEALHRRRDGAQFPVLISCAIITVAGREYVICIDRDISELQRAQRERSASEANYRGLVEHLPAIIYTARLDEASSTMYVSPQVESILGFTPEEWTADPTLWLAQVHPDDRARVRDDAMNAHRADLPHPIEYRAITRDGREVWLRDISWLVRDERGQPLLLQGITLDITDRKAVEEALLRERSLLEQRVIERTADLQAANAELARVAIMKDEFFASMSHELRTPLVAILGFTESLREQSYGAVNDRQTSALAAIEESGRHLLSLINDILDVAKLGAGKLTLTFGPVSVREICDACIRMVRHELSSKRLRFSSAIDPAVTTLWADSRRLRQVLVNLLSNAVKFTPDGGEVGLAVIGDAAAGAVRFTVWDTGIGIAPDQLPLLFQPFVQLDSHLARQYEGTGLGLVLVARLTELHGGGVSVESAPGIGSRFTVTLPWQVAPLPG